MRYAGKQEVSLDPKRDIIRRVLYPTIIRNRASPTGTWRPDVGRRVQRAIPSVQAHETIERAWLLHKRHVRRERQAALERKFESMRNAMETLRLVDPERYEAVNKEEDPRMRTPEEIELLKKMKGPEKKAFESRIRGLFPRELRTPTETPSLKGWEYEWTPLFKRPTEDSA